MHRTPLTDAPIDDDADDAVFARERSLTAHISERLLDLAGVGSGARVLDVACGRGEPALRAALRVGAPGRVVAIDSDPVVVRVCAAAAAAKGLRHVDARVCAAAAIDVDLGAFDVVTCRFGLMYVATPVRALQRMHRVLAPAGRVAVALWGRREDIAWWRVPRDVTARFADLPPVPADAPWAGRYGNVDDFVRDAASAGLVVDAVETMTTDVVRGDVDHVVAWVEHVFGAWVARVPDGHHAPWRQALVAALDAHRDGDDVVLGGVTTLAVARAD
jgi:SAM-dependent methyltransferase